MEWGERIAATLVKGKEETRTPGVVAAVATAAKSYPLLSAKDKRWTVSSAGPQSCPLLLPLILAGLLRLREEFPDSTVMSAT